VTPLPARRATLAVATALLALAPSLARGEGEPRTHTIVRGDTLGALARRYGVSVAAIVTANRLASERVTLRLGRRLAIPGRGAAPRPAGQRAPGDFLLAVPEALDDAPAFGWPVEGVVISPFGRRRDGWHRGIDIKAPTGSPVLAAAPGVVITSGVEGRYGRLVRIAHDGGFVTLYAHNDENLVAVGDRVGPGERIGTVGRTGRATTPHVHFEVRRGGRVLNPLYLLPYPPTVQVEETSEESE
jgi:murein DD-endopeptidase MepM/ murein hydrolase activator NlpD